MNKIVPLHAGPLDAGRFNPSPEDSYTLPAAWYYEPEIYRLEHEAIFYKTWWYQCHESDVALPGDYYSGAVMDQDIFIMRGGDNELRAFYNVCSHRAHPLVKGEGNTKLIVCPYHQWCYQSDGRFRGARGRDTLKDWIPDNADLKEVRVESYGGFLFVNLDTGARPLAEQAPQLLKDMYANCPRLDELRRAERYKRHVDANWKTVIDNNHECYHCAVNHKSLLELVDYESKAVWSDDGITFSHAVENNSLNNSAYEVDEAEAEQQSLFGYIFPCQIPLFFPGSASCAMFQVIPTGPETTLERWDFYFATSEPTPQERGFMDFIKNVLIPEDVGLCENVQRGLHSRGYTQGRFVVDRARPEFSEHHVHFFQKMVHDALKATD